MKKQIILTPAQAKRLFSLLPKVKEWNEEHKVATSTKKADCNLFDQMRTNITNIKEEKDAKEQ